MAVHASFSSSCKSSHNEWCSRRNLSFEQLEERFVLDCIAIGAREPDVPDRAISEFVEAYQRVLNWGSPNSLYLDNGQNCAASKVYRWGPGFRQDFRGGRFDEGA